jgi:hypothetical protein
LTKAEALHIAFTAIVRELLREDDGVVLPVAPGPPSPEDPPSGPQPQFDFDESVCEHGGVFFERATCPVHGPQAQAEVTAEELDDITSEEPPGLIQRAKRLAEQKARQARSERLFPEDIPMSGMAPPEELP